MLSRSALVASKLLFYKKGFFEPFRKWDKEFCTNAQQECLTCIQIAKIKSAAQMLTRSACIRTAILQKDFHDTFKKKCETKNSVQMLSRGAVIACIQIAIVREGFLWTLQNNLR